MEQKILDLRDVNNSSITYSITNDSEFRIKLNDINNQDKIIIRTNLTTIKDIWVLLNTCNVLISKGCLYDVEAYTLMCSSDPYKRENESNTFELVVNMLESCDANQWTFVNITNEYVKEMLSQYLNVEFL